MKLFKKCHFSFILGCKHLKRHQPGVSRDFTNSFVSSKLWNFSKFESQQKSSHLVDSVKLDIFISFLTLLNSIRIELSLPFLYTYHRPKPGVLFEIQLIEATRQNSREKFLLRWLQKINFKNKICLQLPKSRNLFGNQLLKIYNGMRRIMINFVPLWPVKLPVKSLKYLHWNKIWINVTWWFVSNWFLRNFFVI